MVNFRTVYRAKSPDGCDSFGGEGGPYGSLSTWQAISTRISAEELAQDRKNRAKAFGGFMHGMVESFRKGKNGKVTGIVIGE